MAAPDWYQKSLQASATVCERGVFFIVGCPKSGTSWLVKLLGSHPELCCRGEGHFTDVTGRLIEHAVRVINEQPKMSWKYGAADTLAALRLLCDQTFAAYLAQCPDLAAIRLVGDKTPESALAMPLLDTLYPGARFVHIIRDGRDAAVSGWSQLQRYDQAASFPDFAAYAGHFARAFWRPYIDAARKAGQAIPDRYLEIRYEDLHRSPIDVARSLLEFLGVAADPALVEGCVEQASFKRLTGGRANGDERPDSHFRKGVVGDWTNHFDDAAIAAFDAGAAALLAELGYRASSSSAA